MLEFLKIKNLALIQDAEIEFSPGLNVITGESGAGKSIILKALDFALGERLNSDIIRPNKEKASVEALFTLNKEEVLVKREIIKRSGRSRIYINDSLCTQKTLKSLREKLILYTSQHEQHKLIKPEYHTQLLDQYIPSDLLIKKNNTLEQIRKIQETKNKLKQRICDLDTKKELMGFQLQEIKKIAPKPKEDQILLQKRENLRNSAKLGEKIQQALDVLCSPEFSLLENIFKFQAIIQNITSLDPDFKDILGEIEHTRDIFHDLESRLRSYPVGLKDIYELEQIEARLWELEQLKKRLNKSLDEIIKFQEELELNISTRDKLDLELKEIEKKETNILNQLKEITNQINIARREVSTEISKKLKHELLDLGFERHIEIYFEFFSKKIHLEVEEQRAKIMWKPNPGQKLQPLNNIVSGGELSRVFLGLISISIPEEMPTLIFDEVDTGIGGLTLLKIGKKIKELSKQHQVLLITHWPQLASLADRHFKVHKEVIDKQTYTRCNLLKGKEVEEELSRMAGGGEQGRILASQLLKENKWDKI